MAEGTHGAEQGLRLHHLANLGGLVVLAGLDLEPPDFLLGALLSIAREAAALSAKQRAEIAARGQVKLDQRASGKRAWTSWKRARELHGLTLSSGQIRRVMTALEARAPGKDEELVPALMRALAGVE